jgi:hypothetical protein
MAHFKEFLDPNYLCNIDFLNNDMQYIRRIVTITDVKKGEVHDGKSKKAQAESVVVLHLKECKPLILSNRNFKTIIRMTRKVDTDNWKGTQVELYIKENVKAFGEMWDVVTVSNRIIAPKAAIDYSKQIETLRKCTSLDELRAAYSSLTSAEQAATVSVKDELKTKLA